MRQSPKVVTKQELMMELWGDEEPESDALRSHIYNLRKMVDKPFDPKAITYSGRCRFKNCFGRFRDLT